jgi:hypothetical protein
VTAHRWVVGGLAALLGAGAGGGLWTAAASRGVRRGDFDDRRERAAVAAHVGDDVAAMLHDATLAPSGHNTQPWRVVIEARDRLRLCVEPVRVPRAVDPDRREVALGLGAFLENAAASAASRGVELGIDVIAASLEDDDVARLHIGGGRGTAARGDVRLNTRCTIRAPFATTAIPAATIARLVRAGGDEAVHYMAADTPRGRAIAEATVAANRQQARRDDVQDELAAWLRWRDPDARAHRDGLTTEALGLDGLAGWYVRHFFSRGSSLQRANRERAIETAHRQATGAAGWFVVVAGEDAAAVIDAGRRFERVALDARAESVALHPMSQALEEAPWKDQLATTLGLPPGRRARMIVRAGHVDHYPAAVSLRRPLTDVVARA